MNTYYKVTRPDGSSFHDPDVVYAVGKRVRPKPHEGKRQLCGPGVLHASEHPWQAAVYALGEFRIFKVEGRPILKQRDKSGFKQLTVAADVPVHKAFGPNGKQVQAVWERYLVCTDEELKQLRAAGGARDAWDAWDARHAASVWDARAAGPARAAGDAWAARAAGATWAVWDARDARAAAVAYINPEAIGTDGYTQAHYDTLVGPWEQVIGVWNPETGEWQKETT